MIKEKRYLIAFLAFFFLIYILSPIFKLIFDVNSLFQLGFIEFLYEGILALIMVLIYKDLLKEGYKKVKSFIKKSSVGDFVMIILKCFIVCSIVNIAVAMFTSVISNIFGITAKESINQTEVVTLLKEAPIFMIISASIFAPFTEELMFRGWLGEIIKNKRVFIAVSGLIFGLVHITDSITIIVTIIMLGYLLSQISTNNQYSKRKKVLLSVIVTVCIIAIFLGISTYQYGNLLLKIKSLNVSELLSSLTYISFGAMFAYYYQKYNNIYVTIGIHFLQNSLSMIMLLFF